MNQVKIYISHIDNVEKAKMTMALPFLYSKDDESKNELINLANTLYSKDKEITMQRDNGNLPCEHGCRTYSKDKHFYNLIQFEQKDLTDEAINALGKDDEFDWRYFYSIAICREDRELYLLSFSNACSPNWNGEYNLRRCLKLQDVDFPILKEDRFIYRIEDVLHGAINEKLMSNVETFKADDNHVSMVIKDQHGNYKKIEANSLEDLFRDFADNYCGYRNYKRQMASEWEIVNDVAKQTYEEWKENAKGLKSSFDKFYGGIVD